MLALLLLVVRRPTSDVSRFALVWSACALAGFAIPPRFSEHYLLPSTPALAMAIASYGFSFKDVVRRPIVALIAVALLALTAVNAFEAARGFDRYAAYVEGLGRWIRSSVGSGAVMYSREFVPEVQLASDAVSPGKSGVMAGALTWQRLPQVIIFGPYRLPDLALQSRALIVPWKSKSVVYEPVCPGRTGRLIVYAESSAVAAFRCVGLQL
jgi:4-amino-4-deoxy-L-arabinose transferase-like glycosyltransferase